MADLATLQIAVDSRPVTKAAGDLDTLTTSAGRTGASVDKLTAANARMAAAFATSNKPLIEATRYLTSMQLELEKVGKSSLQIKAMEIKMAAAAAPTAALAAEIRKTGAELIRAERNAIGFTGAGGRITNSAGQQRAGMQQLSFQIQDVAQQFALGTNPMVIFAQQGGQVISALSMMTNKTGGFLGFLAGPWGAVLTGAAMILMPLISKLFETEDALDKVKIASNNLSDVQSMMSPIFDLATGKMGAQTDAAMALAKAQIILARATSEANAAQARSKITKSTEFKGGFSGGMGGGINFTQSLGAEAGVSEMVLNGMSAAKGIDMLKQLEKQRKISKQTLVEMSAAYANFAVEQENQQRLDKAEASLRDGVLVPSLRRETKERQKKNTEYEQAVKAAENFIEAINKETASFGKNAIELKRMEVATAAAAAPTKALARDIQEAGIAWERSYLTNAFNEASKEIKKMNDQAEREIELSELTGDARKMRAIDLQEEAKMAELNANALGMNADQVIALTDEWKKYFQTLRGGVNVESSIADRKKYYDGLKQTLTDIRSMTDELTGGIGGAAMEFKSKVLIAAPTLENNLKNIFNDFTDEQKVALKTTFDDFVGNLAKTLAYASIGGAAGGGVGGALGGVAGGFLGEKLLGGTMSSLGTSLGKKIAGEGASKLLGEAFKGLAGPLGALAGGLLGSVIGGLFTKTKQASATLANIGGQAAISTIKGNDAKFREIANSMATGLLKGIANIAEQLGGQLGGAVSLSIGQRKKDFVVDPTGQGRTKGAGVINFGEDQAAAIAYATQLAIQQGIITGLSAGANTLIKAGGDLQAQLEKALKFDQVFKDLREQTDPLGYALDNLSKEMEKLKAVFAEAGATAADYAALEELYSIKRQRVIMDAERPRRELEIQLMEATGDAAGALAAKRMLELDAMDASLRALQQQIYAAQDAAAARELEAAAQEAALQEQLAAAEAQRAAEAELARQREEAAQRVKEAEDALRQAYDREASAFRDTIDRFRDLGKTLREFAATLLPLNGNGRASLNELNRKFRETAALARLGNTEAMAALPGIGGELRDAIIDTATDRVSMLRRLSEVRAETESVADVADRQVSIAQQQLDALTTQVEQFVTLNDSVLSVRDAIVQLQAAQAAAASIGAASVNAANAAVSTANAAAKTQGYSAAQQLYMDTLLTMQGQGSPSEIRDYVAELSDYQSLASLANITGQYDAEKYAGMTGYEIAADLSRKFGVAVGTYANGGLHSGGLRVVGENGPELEATGPSRIYNANQLGNMMGGGATAEEVRALRDELKVVMFQIAKNTGKTSDQLQRWDGDGLPDARGF